MLKILFLIIPLLSLQSTNSLTIQCRYNEWDWNFQQNVYECIGTHVNLEDTLPYLTNFTGVHMGGGNHTEVRALRVMHQDSITFVPTGMGKFFPNLFGISFMNCHIKTISNEHLVEFPEMIQISYKMNQIEVLPKDLFIYTPKLKLINFADNNIKHIAAGIFKPLKNLDYIWLAKNVCIDSNFKSSQLKSLRKEISKKCRMGGKTDCKKIPAAFTRWNVTTTVNTCEVIHVYRFKAKPRHELIKLQREKDEQEQKDREHYINNVLRVCEYDDELLRFLTAASNLPGQESLYDNWTPPPLDWEKVDKTVKKKKKGKKNKN